ncbi:MAG: hypothetical protein WB791_05945 [Waddliaceae bacterium]
MNDDQGHFPLRSATDNAILMHRDIHFGGQFSIMLDYYQSNGKGICLDFGIEDIQRLAELEKKASQDLAPLLLTGPEAEKVAKAKDAYKKLRDLYEDSSLTNNYPLLIADLILSEEEEPESEIAAIVKKSGPIVPILMDLLRSTDFFDPLFPGYGTAPLLAAKCLGRIGDKRAIISLFETIGESDLHHDDIALKALQLIGAPAKDFLLRVVRTRPLNFDNERAAIALIAFKDESDVAAACLTLLIEEEVRAHSPLATYLALCCEGLKDPSQQAQFLSLLEDPNLPTALSQDVKTIAKIWTDN